MLNVYEELGDTSRRLILGELRNGPKSVSEIVHSTGLRQPNVSNHLARMREKSVVRASRSGRQIFYSLATPEIESVIRSVLQAPETPDAGEPDQDAVRRFATAATAGDDAACSEIVEARFRRQLSLLDVYQDLLSPAMNLVGDWYLAGAIDEGQEHLASNITERMMAHASQMTAPRPRLDRTAVLGCSQNSWHSLGLRMIHDYLKADGWTSLFLGAHTPTASFVSAADKYDAEMVLVSCVSTTSLNESLDLVRALHRLRATRGKAIAIGVGGRVVEIDWDRFQAAGADFHAANLREFACRILPLYEPGLKSRT